MLQHLTKGISKAIGFSKTESKGVLILIFIISMVLISSKYSIHQLKNREHSLNDSLALAWIQSVRDSYEVKQVISKPGSIEHSSIASEADISEFYPLPVERAGPKPNPVPFQDLNIASAADLQIVHGIGPAFSQRIVKYRTMLGGFADTAQLNEVYGLPPEAMRAMCQRFAIISPVTPIPLNTDSIKHLSSHPYISYELAKVILNYRRQHGDFQTGEDLLKIKAIDASTFLRLKPYLKSEYAENP